MAGLRIKLNIAEFNRLRNSGPVTAHLESIAAGIAARANSNATIPDDETPFTVETVHNRSRVVVFVSGSPLAEARDRALSKAI